MSLPAEPPLLRGEARAGAVLQAVVLGVAAWVVMVSVAAAALSLGGLWRPLVALPVLLVLAAVSARLVRGLPSRSLPLWSAGAMVALSVAGTVWAGVTHSEQVLPRRDAGSTFQSARSLAEDGTRPIRLDADDVGGAAVLEVEGITLESPAYFSIGTPESPVVQPQFLVGVAALTSLGWWAGGPTGAFWVPAVAGGLGLLALGLLVSLLVGPRWGPLAVLATAVCFPVLRVARSTYSEPHAVLVITAGLLALTLVALSPKGSRRLAVLAGGLVGGAALLRPDSLRETLLLAVVLALAGVQRRPWVAPAAWAAVVTTLVAAVSGWLVSSAYLKSIGGSLVPLLALGALLVAAAAAAVALSRKGFGLPTLASAWLPRATGGVVALGLLVLVTRPLWMTVRQSTADPGTRVVAALQRAQGLPVDGGRTYAEDSLTWLSWWVGWPALVLAAVAAVLLSARAAQHWVDGRDLPAWSGPLVVGLGSTVLTAWRPGITPDHPWADRRLLVALSFVIVLVVVVAAWLSRWTTRRLPVAVAPLSSVAVSALLLVPTVAATWPHATERVELGELAAVEQACDAFRPGEVVLAVDDRAADEWPQVLRGQCGVPALAATADLRGDPQALATAVAEVERLVDASGRSLVLLGARSPDALVALGAGDIVPVTRRTVQEDPRLLEQRPDSLVPLELTVFRASPPG